MSTDARGEERTVGQGMPFQRTRRITGYLSTLERFNNAKLKELKDRVKHDAGGAKC